jgi:uncharacterized protein (TIGR00288 family)
MPNRKHSAESQVAVFIDFENLALSADEVYGKCDLGVIISTAEQWGRCTIRRAYSDWTSFSRYQQDLIENSIELTQLFRYKPRRRKNAADIQMVVDALETAFTHPEIDVFILVTGDSDFSAVVRKLRAYGKKVIGIGLRQSTSEALVKACDHFILYDTLVEPDTPSAAYRLERSRQLLLDALRTVLPQVKGDAVNGSQLKMMMLKLDPTFKESDLGYRRFRDFLDTQSDQVQVRLLDGVLWVSLKPSAVTEPIQEEISQCRMMLSTAGLRLTDPRTRTGVLQDMFTLLSEAPGAYTLDRAVIQLKAKYDAESVLRSREEVQEVAKLVKFTDVFDPAPPSWQLDPLTLKPGLQVQAFVDYCESAYLGMLIQKNVELKPDVLALLLFGTLDQRARVERLAALAEEVLATERPVECTVKATTGDWSHSLGEIPQLERVLRDLEEVALNEPPSPGRVAELNNEGLRVRVTDFEQARACFIKAARMACELMRAERPGASLMDLKWHLASYCAASAGKHYYRFEYDHAKTYYLAFFVLARETEPAWEKVRGLMEPMLSFYLSMAANVHGELLEHPPGRTHPARIAVALHKHTNPLVREQWLDQARELRGANSAALRMVIQRLTLLEQASHLPGATETRLALEAIVAGE